MDGQNSTIRAQKAVKLSAKPAKDTHGYIVFWNAHPAILLSNSLAPEQTRRVCVRVCNKVMDSLRCEMALYPGNGRRRHKH